MWLRKASGGTTLTHKGTDYHFPADDPLCEVPDELGHALLAIKGAGYSPAEAPKKAAAKETPKAAPAAAAASK